MKRINTVRNVTGIERLPNDAIEKLARSSLAFGFYRALLDRFSAEHGLTEAWWREKRKEHARNGRDRTDDLAVIRVYYPEFDHYYPTAPLTDAEVVDAALPEFRDQIAGRGTDYYEIETQRAKRRRGIQETEAWTVVPPPHGTDNGTPSSLGGMEPDIIDPAAQRRVEDVMDYLITEDDSHVLGPAVTRALELAQRHYGPSAMYWLADAILFSKRYTEMLRVMGGTEQEMGLKEFERVKRDMVRKIPVMNERMLEILRTDPEMNALREILHADVIAAAAKIPEPPEARQKREICQRERADYTTRQTIKLLRAVENDPDVEHLVEWLQTIDLTEILPEFTQATDGFKWQVFTKSLLKRAGETGAPTAADWRAAAWKHFEPYHRKGAA